jgi:hypothetical protein
MKFPDPEHGFVGFVERGIVRRGYRRRSGER